MVSSLDKKMMKNDEKNTKKETQKMTQSSSQKHKASEARLRPKTQNSKLRKT